MASVKQYVQGVVNAIGEVNTSLTQINAQDVPNKIRELKVQVGSKQLLGTYDGSSVEVTEASVVDIGAMLDEGKLPLEVNVNIETPIIEGTIDITENGTYDVSQYASANVNVASSGGGEDMLQTLIYNTNSCKSLFSKYVGDNIDFLGRLDTSNVTDMSSMFEGCLTLKAISSLNTSNVTNMSSMFSTCRQLTSIPQLNTSKVTKMSTMFYQCWALTTIPSLDTSSVADTQKMFQSCEKLITIPQLDLSKVNYLAYMFNGCYSLESVPSLDTSNANNMISLFSGCKKLKSIDGLNMIKCTSTSDMFYGCTNLENLTLYNIKTNLTIGSGTSYGHLLTLESLIGIVKELINAGSAKTLTMGSANLNKIASTYVKFTDSSQTTIATNTKGDVVVCESTDSGAMLLSDYATLKRWTLA